MSDSVRVSLITASVAAVSGILTSVWAAISSARNSRKLVALEAALARQKEMTLEYMKVYLTLELEEHNRALEAFKQLIRSVQLLRDKIRRVLEYPDSFSPEVLSKEVAQLSEDISDAYASNQVFLDAESSMVAHALKNDCVKAADVLHRYVRQRQGSLLRKIQDLQESITSRQMDLRTRARLCADSLISEARAQIDKGARSNDR
jgi:hypothetical protein